LCRWMCVMQSWRDVAGACRIKETPGSGQRILPKAAGRADKYAARSLFCAGPSTPSAANWQGKDAPSVPIRKLVEIPTPFSLQTLPVLFFLLRLAIFARLATDRPLAGASEPSPTTCPGSCLSPSIPPLMFPPEPERQLSNLPYRPSAVGVVVADSRAGSTTAERGDRAAHVHFGPSSHAVGQPPSHHIRRPRPHGW
jgi:hypothetical protein